MNKGKGIKVACTLLTLLVILVIGIFILKENKNTKADEFIAYSKMEDTHKLYIKNKKTNEERLLVDKGVLNVCTDGEWVYYIPGDFEGIFKIKMDGTENSKISPLEPLSPVGSTVMIESTMEKDGIVYRLIQYGQGDEPVETQDRYYKLNLKDNSIIKIE